jgi:hypothetical protein
MLGKAHVDGGVHVGCKPAKSPWTGNACC